MSPSASTLAAASFRFATGPLLIETCFGLVLSGITVSQVYFYWSEYKEDPSWMKTLVYSIFGLETLNTILCVNTLYSYLVLEVGNPDSVSYIVWSAGAILLVEMMVVALVQGFYIHRIWQLSHSVGVTLIPIFALFFRCAFGIATSVLTYAFPRLNDFSTNKAVSVTVNFGLTLAVVVDIITSGLVIYYLLKQNAHVRRTKHVVHRLMFYTVNTGALTIVFSMLTLFSFNFVWLSFMFAGFVIISTKVYANSMLAMQVKREEENSDVKLETSTLYPAHNTDRKPQARSREHISRECRRLSYELLPLKRRQGDVTIEISGEADKDELPTTPESALDPVKSSASLCWHG